MARALGELPEIDAAFARGELSYAKVRAMTRVGDADNQSLLVAQARGTTGAEMDRICAGFRKVVDGRLTDPERRRVRRRSMLDGTVQIEIRLLPDEAARVWQAIQQQRLGLAAAARGKSAVAATSGSDEAAMSNEAAISDEAGMPVEAADTPAGVLPQE